ncbi:MAG TPA: hypothetical protein VH482_11540, partial [Thermomicrobiales bacterium]
RNCCNGVCCPAGQCCANGTCSVDACAPHCVIDGVWIADGTINPQNECEICDRDRDESNWSTAASGTACGEPGQCCNLGLCQTCGCRIGGQDVASGAINPDNACEVCDPVQDPSAWSPLSDESCGDHLTCCAGACCEIGECCNTSGACEPCRCVIDNQEYEAGTLNPGHDCEYCDPNASTTRWTSVADFTDCGFTGGRVCCNGGCCSPTECCTPTGCEECGPICRIDEHDVHAGTVDPDDPCQLCDPDRNRLDWSEAPDDFVCGGDLDESRVCCRGLCCDPGECCDDGCKPCRCHIGLTNWDAGTPNPLNHCEVCDPDQSRDEWSHAPNRSDCGLGNGRECCEGQCCPSGQCCNDIGECAPCPCHINGQDYGDGTANPNNTCQVCDVDRNRDDWTTLDDNEACGTDADDRVCCSGNCCPQGQCCDAGTCKDCGCEIGGGDPIPAGTPNRDNPCQVCDPSRSRLSWSSVDNGTACGANGEQKCCGGECCASDECCILDACGTCLCQIAGKNYAANVPNPDNPCEVCDPDADPFAWSTAADDTSCGDGQVCCTGACCDPGLCCTLGLCGFCGCRIGDQDVAEFAINPDNVCEWCDPVLDQFSWSPRSDESCGDNGDQTCCSGVCCDPGLCCDLSGACAPCPCEIDGVTYVAGASNPDNPCEICDSLSDRNAWSDAAANTPCGANGDQFCCAGACCPDGECCHFLDGACGPEPCHCTIGDDEVAEGDFNPDNECELCDPTEDPLDWTPLAGDAPCGANGDQVCCEGICCDSGLCCTLGLCGPCGCQIGGKSYGEGAVNPDNPCQVCDPVLDQFSWSPAADDTSCGTIQVCCGGTCCGPNERCGLGGSCEQSNNGCAIGGVTYPAGMENPTNSCAVCDPSQSRTDWSPVPDNTACGANGDQICCNGVCCRRGMCCTGGHCDVEFCHDPCVQDPDSCQCVIEGTTYANGTVNPNNPCQYCEWHNSPSSWTNVRDDSPCGANGQQYCCRGVCCADGECCTNDGACATGGSTVCDGCDIDGRFYPTAKINPANQCEFCSPFKSKTSWSPTDNHVPCGANLERNCCNGVCCAAGLCCTGTSVGGTCQPCACEIDGGSYVAGQINPANWCQTCDPTRSTTSWSISDATFCASDFSRDCCNGVCCFEGTCCGFSGVCETMLPDVSNCVNWQF